MLYWNDLLFWLNRWWDYCNVVSSKNETLYYIELHPQNKIFGWEIRGTSV